MSPARRWSPFSVVARACIVGLLIAGCGSSSSHSIDAAPTTTTASTNQPSSSSSGTSASPSSAGSVDSVDSVDSVEPTDAVEAPTVDSSVVDQAMWLEEDLGAVMADAAVSIVTDADATTLIHTEGGSTLRVATSVAGGPFVSHVVPVAGAPPILGVSAAATPAGLMLILTDTETFKPRVMTSADGVDWTELEPTGLDQPADISALISLPGGGLLAAGAVRTGPNPANGPFAPGMWQSADGVTWHAVALPADLVRAAGVAAGGGDGVRALLAGRDGVVAVIGTTIVRSADDGATWTAAGVTAATGVELQSIDGLAGDGNTMVALGSAGADSGRPRLVTLRSRDDGQTWDAALLPDPGPGTLGGFGGMVAAADDAFWIATIRIWDAFGDGDVCYRDLASCRRGSDAVLLRSSNGIDWREVDLSEIDTLGLLNILGIVDRPAGVMVVGTTQGLRGWTWPTDDAPPPMKSPPVSLPPPHEPLAEHDGTLTSGMVYRFPLFLHCGMGYLGTFNGKVWTLDPRSAPINPETGGGETPPAGWPVAGQTLYGYITLVEPGTIEYSLPSGEVIAKFHPTTSPPELCE